MNNGPRWQGNQTCGSRGELFYFGFSPMAGYGSIRGQRTIEEGIPGIYMPLPRETLCSTLCVPPRLRRARLPRNPVRQLTPVLLEFPIAIV